MTETAAKKRVLFVGEASFLHTGFSNIYGVLIPLLVATGKYEIAEFGSYASQSDPRVQSVIRGRWKFYGNNPETPEEEALFNQTDDPGQPGQNTNQFGRWKFDAVVSDFRPDIVIDIRDWWMIDFQRRSPLRKFFQWLVMPTVDSIPQKEEWIATYNSADYVMAYSDFGIDSLRKSSPLLELRFNPPNKDVLGLDGSQIDGLKKPGRLHPIPLRPGVDLEVFKPMDKVEVRTKWGIEPADTPVILLVQRNQARKRINEAIQAFAYMKGKYGKESEAVRKAMMILHTNWPDNQHSADYPRCIERTHKGYHGMPYQHRNIYAEILNTFMCNNPQCGNVFLDYAIKLRQARPDQGYAIACPACQQMSARPPNTSVGYTREQLAEVYNLGDILLQMSIAEGCGMPVQEAKACGTMTLVTDYAAIAEKGRVPDYDHINASEYDLDKGGDVLKVAYMYEEAESTGTNCWRAHTSIEDAGDQMAKYLMDEELLRKTQKEASECAVKHYDWNDLVRRWEFILDKKEILDRDQTWNQPPRLIQIATGTPSVDLPAEQFIDWCYIELLGYSPQSIDQEGKANWLRTLEMYAQQGKQSHEARDAVMDFFRREAQSMNNTELLRSGTTNSTLVERESDPDTISAIVIA